MLFEILQNIARKVFEKALTDVDSYLRIKRERGKLKNTGKREKYFLTRFGDILYARTRYKDKKTTMTVDTWLPGIVVIDSIEEEVVTDSAPTFMWQYENSISFPDGPFDFSGAYMILYDTALFHLKKPPSLKVVMDKRFYHKNRYIC